MRKNLTTALRAHFGRSLLQALLLDALIGHDPTDKAPTETPTINPLADIEGEIEGVCLGCLVGAELHRSDDDVAQNYEALLNQLERLGAIITEFQFPRPIDDYLGPVDKVDSQIS